MVLPAAFDADEAAPILPFRWGEEEEGEDEDFDDGGNFYEEEAGDSFDGFDGGRRNRKRRPSSGKSSLLGGQGARKKQGQGQGQKGEGKAAAAAAADETAVGGWRDDAGDDGGDGRGGEGVPAEEAVPFVSEAGLQVRQGQAEEEAQASVKKLSGVVKKNRKKKTTKFLCLLDPFPSIFFSSSLPESTPFCRLPPSFLPSLRA